MINNEILLAIIVMSLVNLFTRVLPFAFFSKKELPSYLAYVGKYFPAIIMTILIVYSIKDINFTLFPYGLKEISAVLFTAILHLRFKNYLVSIFLGTIFYMFLVQFL